MKRNTRPFLALACLAFALLAAGRVLAREFDPVLVEDVGVVEIITSDEDGDERKTKVWVVVIDGEAYLRTSGSRWLANLQRNPQATLRVEGSDYAVETEVLSEPGWIEKVDAASKQKYGWQETWIHFFRMNEPTIIRLSPASP